MAADGRFGLRLAGIISLWLELEFFGLVRTYVDGTNVLCHIIFEYDRGCGC
jgi:hypothetical protein